MSNLSVFVGCSLLVEGVVLPKAGANVALNLTGASITFAANAIVGANEYRLDKSIGDGITVTSLSGGAFNLQLRTQDTEIMGSGGGSMEYYIRVSLDDEHDYVVQTGRLVLMPLPA